MAHGGGKEKKQQMKDDIANIDPLTIVIKGDGMIESIKGGGHKQPMTAYEFSFADTFLDINDYLQDTKKCSITTLVDMSSLTVLTVQLKDANGNTEYRKYVWEGSRYWW